MDTNLAPTEYIDDSLVELPPWLFGEESNVFKSDEKVESKFPVSWFHTLYVCLCKVFYLILAMDCK